MTIDDPDIKLVLNPVKLSKTQNWLLFILGILFVLQGLINLLNVTKMFYLGLLQIVFGLIFIIITSLNFPKINHPNFIRISNNHIGFKKDGNSEELIIPADQIKKLEISAYSFGIKSSESEYTVSLENLSHKQRREDLRQFVKAVNKFKEVNNIN